MDHETHVGLVDPHAEGDGRHHHRGVRLQELLQPVDAHLAVEAGVIGQRRNACVAQRLGELVHPIAGTGVDDARAVRPRGHQVDHTLVARAALALR